MVNLKLKVPKIPGGWPSDTEASSEESRIPTLPPTERKPKRQGISDMAPHSRPAKKIRVQSKASRVLTALKRPANMLKRRPIATRPAQARPAATQPVVAKPIVVVIKPTAVVAKPGAAPPQPKPIPQDEPTESSKTRPKASGYVDATIELPKIIMIETEGCKILSREPYDVTGLIANDGPTVAVKGFHDKVKRICVSHFPNEVKTMFGRVGVHPNIIKAFQADIYTDLDCCMTLEFCELGDLTDRLKYFSRLQIATPVIFSLHLTIQLAEALAFIHNGLTYGRRDYEQNTALHPLIHGDLKPDNILLRRDGMNYGMPTFVLADFGLAAPASKPHSCSGTPGWYAPEVRAAFEGLKAPPMTVRSDVYTYGMVIFNAITRRRWQTGAKPQTLRLPAPYERVNLEKELKWCLALNFTDRPAMHGGSNGILPFVLRLRKEREAIFKRDGPLDKMLWGRKKKAKKGEHVADWIPADKYTLVKALQSGTEASTSLTASATTGRIFVVKKFSAYYDEWTEDGKVQARGPLPNEAAVLLEKITPHKSILNALGADFVCIYKGMHCNLYTDFCDAGDLAAQISHTHKQRGIAPEVFILHLFVSLADAIAYIHTGIIWDAGNKRHRQISDHKGYLHGDVKPGNTFLQWTKDQPLPRVVLGDFGMAQPQSNACGIFGTRVFFSPEQTKAHDASREPPEARKEMRKTLGVTTQKSDVYALAQTIIDAMTYDLHEIGADPYTEPVTHDDKKGWQGVFLPKSFEVVALKGALQRCLVADSAKRCNLHEYSADGLQGTIGVLRAERDRKLEEAENIPREFWRHPREVVEMDNEFLLMPAKSEEFQAVGKDDGDMLR
ncbi:hypothetical protein B0A48_09542 [Cryoendolithus antarcticus]|uniref:non-specific serine/threonine protein kinase n=1 Tax=Cryoendolithus antarcticus TaxID=1507870 RepID=A0A1V8SZW3_9PEZI|nr:hypothetical protein B0A48_09542 [Cryoendolithus antarcticus]